MNQILTVRKPHRDLAGYVTERRNQFSGGHTVIFDCKLAEKQGEAIVADYVAEGGRYQILCNEHGHLVYCDKLRGARECMKDPTDFCMVCRCIAGEGPANWESELTQEEVVAVWLRQKPFRKIKRGSASSMELEDPSMTWGWIKGEHEITPIRSGKDGKWVTAELHEGEYLGTDGKCRIDNGTIYALHSDECNRIFGQCYPFGTLSGGEVSYYIKNGATIKLREVKDV